MATSSGTYVGIDVSKDRLGIAVLGGEAGKASMQFTVWNQGIGSVDAGIATGAHRGGSYGRLPTSCGRGVVLQIGIHVPTDLVHPSWPKRLPTVLTQTEAMSVINSMRGTPRFMAKILYGSGLRLMECMCLLVKDIDFENHQIIVRGGKGDDDRFTILADSVASEIKHILSDVKVLHNKDLLESYGETHLPKIGKTIPMSASATASRKALVHVNLLK